MLAKMGTRAVLFERQRETGDALCGGFLSWRSLDALRHLGIELENGHSVEHLRLFSGKQTAQAPLPQRAIGLSRHYLDQLLIDKARAMGAGVEVGIIAKSWVDKQIILSDSASFAPETMFLATGKHDVNGLGRPRDADQTLGLRIRLRPGPTLVRLVGGAIELHFFERGYCGIVLQENGQGNLCLAVRKSRFAQAASDPTVLLSQWADESPAFGDRLAFKTGTPDAIGAVPYGWVAKQAVPGVFRLGDQAAVIPSLAGEGNAIAIASGMMAAKSWAAGESSQHYQQGLARAVARPMALARIIWRLSEAPASAHILTRLAGIVPWLAGHLAGQTRIRH